jgi:ribosomal protein S18 acetylase RimI-like enzyme
MQPLPQSTVIVRDMRDSDFAPVSELAARVWRAHYISMVPLEQIDYMLESMCSPKAMATLIQKKNQRFFVLEDAGVLAGYGALEPQGPREYYLDKLYIDTTRHRQGLGSALLAHIERIVKPKVLTLRVNRANIQAINFYMRHGFFITAMDVKKLDHGFIMDDFLMRWEA